MQYMEERKRGAREVQAQSEDTRQTADSASAAEPEAAATKEMSAPASPRARRVVAPPASGSSGTRAPTSITAGLPTGPGMFGGSLARGVEEAREQMARALRARQAGQRELPLELPAEERTRSARRSADESRDELIERLLDPELTLQETAKLLNVCPTTVRRYTNRGVLNHFRTPGNQRRFRLSDVLEFMRRQQGPQGEST